MIQKKKPPHGIPAPPAWLLLVHQLPAKPSNIRVKVWRRLQNVGALPVKNSVYVLPHSPQALEDFEWIKAEIVALKGQASVFAAESVDSLSADELVSSFRRARSEDYERVRREAEKLLVQAQRAAPRTSVLRRRLSRRARLLHEHYDQIAAIDFFGAPAREPAAAALARLDRALEERREAPKGDAAVPAQLKAGEFHARRWVTRPRPGVDRMASAWLIRRFIDAEARFGFVDRPAAAPQSIPFDMFGVEFSHQGNRCTFETLAEGFGVEKPGVEWLGRIVHDLDLKDGKYAVPEAASVGRLIDGLQQLHRDDSELLEQGMTMFEALYRSYADRPSPAAKPARRAPGKKRRGRK